jgi:glycosyltransferase involved in cell wall biosynthesis
MNESDRPLVTIVTPSFNQAPYLEATIQSVLNQEYNCIEYIIIDGGSTDGSVDIIRKYATRISAWVSELDRGQTDAINKGFARANGEFLAWINSDDTLLPNAVVEAVDFLRSNPKVGMVYGDTHYIDAGGRVIGKFPAAQTDLRRLRRGYVHIPQQASFFRKTIWDEVGPLDPDFYFAMDYDLWVRIATRASIQYLPSVWANFRLHEDAKTIAADDQCWPEMLKVHFRDGGTFFAPIVLKHFIRKLAAPIIRWKRKKLFSGDHETE